MTNRQYIESTGCIPEPVWTMVQRFTSIRQARIIIRDEGELAATFEGMEGGTCVIGYRRRTLLDQSTVGFVGHVVHECVHGEQWLRYGRLGFWARVLMYQTFARLRRIPPGTPESSPLEHEAYDRGCRAANAVAAAGPEAVNLLDAEFGEIHEPRQ